MAEECRDSTVAICSSTQANWWDPHAAAVGSFSSWSNPWQQQQQQPPPPPQHANPNSNSSNCDDHDHEDVSMSTSFTNASNHSSLSVDSSRRLVDHRTSASSNDDFIGSEQVSDNQIWSHVLLNVGNNELPNNQDVGENFLDALSSSKSLSTHAMYEPAYCDYLKKLDNTSSTWEFTNSSSSAATSNFSNNFEKQMNGFSDDMIHENERLTKLVSTWSIAPPEPAVQVVDHHRQLIMNPQLLTSNNIISLSSPMDHDHHYSQPNFCNSLMVEAHATPGALHGRPSSFANNRNINSEYQIHGLNSPMGSDHNSKYYYGNGILPDSYSSSNTTGSASRNFADVISFSSRLGKPLMDIHAPNKPSFKSSNLSEHPKKQGQPQTSAPTRTSGRGQGTANHEGKKKRTEADTSDQTTVLKKPKQESSTLSSSVKMQAPKVKLGDRITALQQIVSPFGKTDTASVLYEAIQYIKFLQDQVHVLLSNPYLKTNAHKEQWGTDRKDYKGDAKIDLKSRGLCLVPISCTPQVYRENTGSDYWTPTYRGCLYR